MTRRHQRAHQNLLKLCSELLQLVPDALLLGVVRPAPVAAIELAPDRLHALFLRRNRRFKALDLGLELHLIRLREPLHKLLLVRFLFCIGSSSVLDCRSLWLLVGRHAGRLARLPIGKKPQDCARGERLLGVSSFHFHGKGLVRAFQFREEF
jgi:hypothetical protein